jgi:DNA helicase II / ATP-dependent DNA helicase PcrA
MPLPKLTNDQRIAVSSTHRRVFIEAPPGAGKTTVAAARFGVLRFNRSTGSGRRAVGALSFTRSATRELYGRIRERWGSTAVAWPNGVTTIDGLICSIVEYLLRAGVITWPGGHTALTVLDTWRGHRGYRWLEGGYRRVAAIANDRSVTSVASRIATPQFAIGGREPFHAHLARGLCTHEEMRDVLLAALRLDDVREVIADHLARTVGHLVVDEVFDANLLDLGLIEVASEVDVAITLVGDPWQALYGFRGARPELVPQLLGDGAYQSLPLTESFRFQSDEMLALSIALRSGHPVALDVGDEFDVVLAAKWDDLWRAGETVLPMSFGRTTNKTDAAAILLLDQLVYSAFGHHAIFLPEALVLLDLSFDAYAGRGQSVLGGVLDNLSRATSEADRRTTLNLLRSAVKTLGSPRRPPSGNAHAEQRQLDRLAALASRVRASSLVPGMTIHQAKGREWDRVGVALTAVEIDHLAAGLVQEKDTHRALYVALTRARQRVSIVA